MKTLIVGDIVGKLGRSALKEYLANNKYDFVIVNGENSASGFGITDKIYREFIAMGVNAVTSGNHTFDRQETPTYINKWDNFLRPLNNNGNPLGNGYKTFNIGDFNISVVNLLGRVFMGFADDPFKAFDNLYNEIENTFIIVDFHAEATAEKIAFANYVDGRAAVVFGTHTHVQTNDLRILPKGTLYITDVGMCGSLNSCIGMELSSSIERFTSCYNTKMKVEVNGAKIFNAIEFEVENNLIKNEKTINIVNG